MAINSCNYSAPRGAVTVHIHITTSMTPHPSARRFPFVWVLTGSDGRRSKANGITVGIPTNERSSSNTSQANTPRQPLIVIIASLYRRVRRDLRCQSRSSLVFVAVPKSTAIITITRHHMRESRRTDAAHMNERANSSVHWQPDESASACDRTNRLSSDDC